MSTDYGAMERQFLETLKADTGRGLDEWMSAIASQGLTQRNDIIDWLRRQGFMFSKASWIERIHNNGGRPIYEAAGTKRPRAARRPAPRETIAPRPAQPPPRVEAPAPAPVSKLPQASPNLGLDALLARAKAYRPLAVYLLAEIRKAVPAVTVQPVDGGVVFLRDAQPFGALGISSKDLRLGLKLAATPEGVALDAPRLQLRGAPETTKAAILTDARQITPQLMAAVAKAAAEA